jgi:outer membrane protein OmpA-like peptidoglycan-associated protein
MANTTAKKFFRSYSSFRNHLLRDFSKKSICGLLCASVAFGSFNNAGAQDLLPADNGLEDYHTAPRWRESEEHPLRIAAYILHPIGWVAREVLFRPLSYFASSTEKTRSVMGFREPFDYRQPECFSSDDSVPDCRTIMPFSYDKPDAASETIVNTSAVYFPNVNFDFNKRALNTLGKGKVAQITDLLKKDGSVKVVLQGHADYIGAEKFNEKLGMDRAEAVRSALIASGIAADRLSAVTFGESQPLINEKTDAARAVNRRVEVHVDETSALK